MRLLICAGGTGGGVYPALAVLQSLQLRTDGATSEVAGGQSGVNQAAQPGISAAEDAMTVLWVGGIGGMEADLVRREGVRFETIPAGQIHGVSLGALPRNAWQLSRGFFASRRVLRKFSPDALFFTGGYLAVPMALASRLFRIGKRLLFVPDIEPGWALKTLARFADQVDIPVEDSRAFFPDHPDVTVTGYPLREGLKVWTKEEARTVFALRDDMPVLLVMGGSKGAHSINQALFAALPELLKTVQVLHLSGNLEWALVERRRNSLPVELQPRYRAYPYLHKEMGAALQAADLAVSRAGASTLGEYPLFGLPAILVPYPYAWRYQRVNAQYLAKHGAAMMMDDGDLPAMLLPTVLALLADQEKLARMAAKMRELSHPEAAATIAAQLTRLASAANKARH